MRLVRQFTATLTVVVAVTFSARAQVLEQIPAESLVVLKVNNLEQTSAKLAKFAQDLGLAMMVPQLNDPLGAMLQEMGIQNGLDKTGELAFAFIDPAVSNVAEDKSMVILFPVSDFDAFVANFPGAKTENGVAEVTMPKGNQPGFIANWGKYAAVSPSKEIVAMTHGGMKLTSPASSKELSGKDMVFFANIPAIKAKVGPSLAEGRAKAITEMEKELTKDPERAKFAPVVKALINQGMNVVEEFLNDSTATTVSINFGETGITSTVLAEFAPDTYLGKMAAGVKTQSADLLAGLPEGKYLVYGGSAGDPQTIEKLINDVLNPVMAELTTADPQAGEAAQRYINGLKAFSTGAKSSVMGWVAPAGNLGQESIFQIVSIQTGDGEQMKAGYADMLAAQQTLMSQFGGEKMKNFMSVETTPNAKTFGGVSFDSVATKINVDPNDPQAAQMQQGISMMYGPNGMNALIGVTGDKMIMGMGVADEVMEGVVAAAKDSKDVLGSTERVKAVSAQLPKQRIGEVYIALDEIARTAGNYAAMFGAPVDVQLPPDLSPIGASVATEGSAIRIDSFTPTDTLRSLVAAGMQAAMQMQQGRKPGKAGGL